MIIRRVLFLAGLGLCLGVFMQGAVGQARFDFDTTPGNLPKSVRPLHYQLRFDLDPSRDDFTGEAEIDVEVREPVGAVVIHARDLEPARLELRQGAAVRVLDMTPGPIDQSWWLEPRDAAVIAPGIYRLGLAWRGRVNASGAGLYAAGIQPAAAGARERMLATQLEPIDARSVFPSFDEPAFRAVFEVTVRAPTGLTVLSNMPERAAVADGAATLHRFEPTPSMPSYLLALAVGRLDVASGTAAGVPLRVFTAPGKAARAAQALAATAELLPLYTGYFGQPYALPKLDQLALPSTRDGAMEDWGLISYSEDGFLFDPARSGPATERAVFGTVAHELAHQWFGNLVTAASWEELWLNEAFATWMADKATRQLRPAWQSGLGQRLPMDRTMAQDAGTGTRAVRAGPVSELGVNDVFDDITYVKGSAVLGMLEQWLGEEPFREGIAAYLQERRLSNATAGDLWFHLGQGARRDVAALAASWTDQPGYPLLQLASRCVGGRTQVLMAQRRFGTPAGAPSAAAVWRIPVRLARGAEVITLPLDAATDGFELPGCSAAPLLANAGGRGYYRVKYEAAALAALSAGFAGLAPADQVTLFSDAFALAREGEQPWAAWLALLARLPGVHGPARSALFEQALAAFEWLDTALAGTPTQPELHAAARRLLAPELARLGWISAPGQAESAEVPQLRALLIEQLARFGDAPTVAEAKRRFDAAESGRRALPAGIRAAVLKAVGARGDPARFQRLLARLMTSRDEEERWDAAHALAAGRDPARARVLLGKALDASLPANVALALPRLVAERSPFGEQAYAFARANWPALAARAGAAVTMRHGLLPGAAAGLHSAAAAARVQADQQELAGADAVLPAARQATQIALRARMRERDAQALAVQLRGWRPKAMHPPPVERALPQATRAGARAARSASSTPSGASAISAWPASSSTVRARKAVPRVAALRGGVIWSRWPSSRVLGQVTAAAEARPAA